MVTNRFFVISFLPTLCSRFKVGRSFAGCSAEYYIRESGLGYTYMEIGSPIYNTMVSLYRNYLFEYF